MKPSPWAVEEARLLSAVRRGRSFILTGHERPDGDTVGCELAFAGFLRARGKKVTIVNAGPPPSYCLFLPGIRRLRSARKVSGRFDAAVVFECSSLERTGGVFESGRQAGILVNIDHHAHHGDYGDINLVDPGVSSNAELVWRILRRAGHRTTAAEATALYVGLVTDTGRFQQENTRPDSHRVAADLMEAGVDVARVHREVYATRSPAALHLMSRALGSLRLALRDRVSLMRLSRRDFSETRARDGDTEDIVNEGLKPRTVLVALFLRELAGGGVKVSFRGKGRVDLCRLAVGLGGGGHRNASGAELAGTLDQAEKVLLARLGPLLKGL